MFKYKEKLIFFLKEFAKNKVMFLQGLGFWSQNLYNGYNFANRLIKTTFKVFIEV